VFRRERDIGKMLSLHGSFAAQAGVLWHDAELCRLAARFAISLVHCDHWEDIFFCAPARQHVGPAWLRAVDWRVGLRGDP